MELSLSELREVVTQPQQSDLGMRVGDKVVIRSVTYHYTGRVQRIVGGAVVLTDAGWLASSGRWSTFLQTGDPDEVEMYPEDVEVHVSLAAIVDWSILPKLPTETK